MFHEHFDLIWETRVDVNILGNREVFFNSLPLLYVVGKEDIKTMDKIIRSNETSVL